MNSPFYFSYSSASSFSGGLFYFFSIDPAEIGEAVTSKEIRTGNHIEGGFITVFFRKVPRVENWFHFLVGDNIKINTDLCTYNSLKIGFHLSPILTQTKVNILRANNIGM
jgi:hypothetical protein